MGIKLCQIKNYLPLYRMAQCQAKNYAFSFPKICFLKVFVSKVLGIHFAQSNLINYGG